MKVTRRALARALATWTAAFGVARLLPAEGAAGIPAMGSAEWREVYPGVWQATIGVPEKVTPVANRLIAPRIDILDRLPRVPTVPLSALVGTVQERGCRVVLPLRPHEQIFGLGLQMQSLAQRGKKKTLRVNADPKGDTGDSHAPVPFYVTTAGIGILVDTARYASIYFGNARSRPRKKSVSATQASPDPVYTQSIEDQDAGSIVIDLPTARGVHVYLFAGPEMIDAVRRYNAFSGGATMPPEWGLGFWYRCDARITQQGAIALAREFREREIPCDVIGLEPGWQTHAYSCTFAWNTERFPDPSGMLQSAKNMHYHVNLWEHAYTHPASPIFSALEPHSGDYGVWGGLVPDFAGEPARRIFGDYHGQALIDSGVSGFKLDECDNSDYTGGWSFPDCSRFPSGADGEQMHSIFGLRYQEAIWQAFRRRNQPTYGLVRSSGALATPYPFVLYSDLYNHRDFIRALVNSGFSGLLWCPEVRDAQSEEDLIRRMQSVVFSPLAMLNGWYIKNPTWKQLDRSKNDADQWTEKWERLEAQCREIIGWRMQLVPYLIASFAQYVEDGTPPFRALALDWPGDKRLHAVDDQFLLGDRMMVAPLFADEPERKVIFPDGDWRDFWTGEKHQGTSEIHVSASHERIPVFVRDGCVVPWADVGQHTAAEETRKITMRVYGDGSMPARLVGRGASVWAMWRGGRGIAEGNAGPYEICAWRHIG